MVMVMVVVNNKQSERAQSGSLQLRERSQTVYPVVELIVGLHAGQDIVAHTVSFYLCRSALQAGALWRH